MAQQIIDSSFGRFLAQWSGEALACLTYEPDTSAASDAQLPPGAQRLRQWFAAYESGKSLPELGDLLQASSTPFQGRMRAALLSIPAGRVRQYGQVAQELGSGPRAVGQACRANPYILIVPCHRVVAKQGMGGYSGERTGQFMALKRRLLAFEAGSVK